MQINTLLATFLIAGLGFSGLAHSSDEPRKTSTIQNIYALENDKVAFQLTDFARGDLNVTENANCIAFAEGTFIIDLTPGVDNALSESAAAQYALLLSAEAQGKSVTVRRSYSCTGGRETISWIRIDN